MQDRQLNRHLYFRELAYTCEHYFIPYISRFMHVDASLRVLEIGCGDGGNLLPFSRLGCEVTGCDMAECRISDASRFFREESAEGTFIASDVFLLKGLERRFNLIICHDVIEHIPDKGEFMRKCRSLLQPGGFMFMSFPAWQMPFGGHQQICRNRLLSHLPFFHLLPASLYSRILKMGGENEGCISELLDIKRTRCPIELFEKCIPDCFEVVNRTSWLVNPHYMVKFGLFPLRLPAPFSSVPYFRNFITTSVFYFIKLKDICRM